MQHVLAAMTAAGLISAAPAASAQDTTQHDVSVTFSPIHLLLPVLELQGEFKLSPQMSTSAILGFGKASDDAGTIDATVFEIGGQFTYYLVGDFDHGMQLGAEVLFLYLSDENATPGGVFGGGLSIGPYIGYKIAADFGLTFMAQVGASFVAVAASGNGTTESADMIGPLVNVNLGWSF